MIHLVTGNKSKIEKARLYLKDFGIDVEQVELDIIEPQSEDIKFIAEFKAKQAFNQTGKPILISDTGWSIPSLKGFPGPLMHYISDWFEVEDFLNLLREKEDRRIFIENVGVYQDNDQIKVFISKTEGKILTEVQGKGLPIDRIATFRKDSKTIAQCKELGIPSFDEDEKDSVWSQFGRWYRKSAENNRPESE